MRKKRLFRFHGPDSRSDNGNWECIIRATSYTEANSILVDWLRQCRRLGDLGGRVKFDMDWDGRGPVVFSTIESR